MTAVYFVWRKSVHDFSAVVVYCSHLKLQHGLESGSKELVYQQFWSLNGMEGLPQKQKYNRIKADPGKLSLELMYIFMAFFESLTGQSYL